MSDAMKVTITINFRDGGEPTASAKIIDLPATEVFSPPPAMALPPPRRRWLTPNVFDGAFVAGGALAAIWWLLS
jgi:hypothetical protein